MLYLKYDLLYLFEIRFKLNLSICFFLQAKSDLASHLEETVVSLAQLKKNIPPNETSIVQTMTSDKNENITKIESEGSINLAASPTNVATSHYQRENSPHPEKFNGNYRKGELEN